MVMYSISYFCTKIHYFKAKIPKQISRPARSLYSFVRPHIEPQMKFQATVLGCQMPQIRRDQQAGGGLGQGMY